MKVLQVSKHFLKSFRIKEKSISLQTFFLLIFQKQNIFQNIIKNMYIIKTLRT